MQLIKENSSKNSQGPFLQTTNATFLPSPTYIICFIIVKGKRVISSTNCVFICIKLPTYQQFSSLQREFIYFECVLQMPQDKARFKAGSSMLGSIPSRDAKRPHTHIMRIETPQRSK